MLAPFDTLPTEVVGHIFKFSGAEYQPHVLQTMSSYTKLIESVTGYDLRNLGQVCRRFAHIVHHTPSLWTTFNLDLRCFVHVWTQENPVDSADSLADDSDDPNGTSWITVLHEYDLALIVARHLERALLRGGHVPLHIELWGSEFMTFPSEILVPLMKHSHRWQYAEFAIAGAMLSQLSPITGNIPLLEQLVLHPWDDELPEEHEPFSFFSDAPRLRTVHCHAASSLFLPHLPIPQLAKLYMAAGSYCLAHWADSDGLIAQSTRLHDGATLGIILNTYPYHTLGHLPTRTVQSGIDAFLVYIATMKSELADMRVLQSLLDFFTLPKLAVFAIAKSSYARSDAPFFWPHVEGLAFLQRTTRGSVHSMDLTGVHVTSQQFLEVLAVLPGLRRLAIDDWVAPAYATCRECHQVPALFDDELLVEMSSALVVPDLKTLIVSSKGAFSSRALLAFLQGRVSMKAETFEMTMVWLAGYQSPLDAEFRRATGKWENARVLKWSDSSAAGMEEATIVSSTSE